MQDYLPLLTTRSAPAGVGTAAGRLHRDASQFMARSRAQFRRVRGNFAARVFCGALGAENGAGVIEGCREAGVDSLEFHAKDLR